MRINITRYNRSIVYWKKKKRGVTYLLRDEFIGPESAPLTSPRSAQPGPGTGTIKDTGDTLDISGGQIVPNAAATDSRDPHIVYGGLARSAGLAVLIRAKYNTAIGGLNNISFVAGFSVSPSLPSDANITGFMARLGGVDPLQATYVGSGGYRKLLDDMPDNTYKNLYVVLRGAGAFLLAESKLSFIFDAVTTTPMYPAISAGGPNRVPFYVDYFRAVQLTAPWDTDYGIATQRLAGSQSAGQTFTHEADALVEYVVTTLPSSGNIDVFFRYQDASNYWYIRVNSAGDIELHEVVATVDTTRGSAAAVVVDGDRVLVAFDDETIFVYQSDALAITYASAANFKTETTGELDSLGTGGAVGDIISWPRNLSGAAKVKLEAI